MERSYDEKVVILATEFERRSAEIIRLNSVNAALLEALTVIAGMSESTEAWTHDELWGNESDVWKNGQSRGHYDAAVIARAAIAKAKAEQR